MPNAASRLFNFLISNLASEQRKFEQLPKLNKFRTIFITLVDNNEASHFFFCQASVVSASFQKKHEIFDDPKFVPHVETWSIANNQPHRLKSRFVLNHFGSKTETLDFIEPSNCL